MSDLNSKISDHDYLKLTAANEFETPGSHLDAKP